ncbi:MAG: hypothetical protein ACI4P3_02505 [Candidatus Spyradosoma sp.]
MKDSEENSPAPAETPAAVVPAKRKGGLRRLLKRALFTLLALSAVLLVVVAFLLGPIVGFVANTFGASFLGVDRCSVGSATIYPFGGYVRFENVEIGRPLAEGVSFSDNLFSVKLLEVDADMFSLFSRKKILDRLEIRGISANYEQLLSGETNVDAVLKNVLGEPSSEEPSEEPRPEPEEEPSEEIFVGARYFVIENVKVGASVRGVPVSFPSMSADFAEGVGIDEDLTPVEFGVKIAGNFMSVIDFFRKSALGDAAGMAVGAVSDVAGATGDAAMAAAGATADFVSGAASLTGDAALATGDAVGDAAKAAAGAVGDAADAVFDIFRSKDDDSSDEKK